MKILTLRVEETDPTTTRSAVKRWDLAQVLALKNIGSSFNKELLDLVAALEKTPKTALPKAAAPAPAAAPTQTKAQPAKVK